MVRLTTISNIFSGIGLAVLGFSLIFKFILEGLGETTVYPFYTWIVGAGILIFVIILTLINTFTEMTGFVHPEDKLVSNMFVFLMTIATILVLGVLDEGQVWQNQLFGISTMIVIAFVFLFLFVYGSQTILTTGETGQLKEMTARFMMVSLVLGFIMAGLDFLLETIYAVYEYTWAALLLGIIAIVLVIIIVMFLIRQYEPVGE